MPCFDCGTTGLTGTIGVTILNIDGTPHTPRSVAGISEPVADSGVYFIADPDPSASLIFVWDTGAATIGSSETLYAGRGIAVGSGAVTWTYTLTESGGDPIADAEVWVSTDAAGSYVVASGTTNASGVATFYLDPGDYYVWAAKVGYDFTNPDSETVAAP
jgi:hypothetical protein